MTKINVINLCFICLMLLTGGCVNFPSNPDLNSNDNNLVKIIYPASNESIGIGITSIEYSLSTPWSLKFMELYINGTFTGNFPPNQDGSKPVINFDLSRDLIGTSFSYYLIYYDTNETSAKSNEISNVHVFESVNPPFAPYNLKLIKLSENSVNLSWSDSSENVDGYEIWKKSDLVSNFQKLFVVDSNVFNINDENLDTAGVYSYKVRGFNQFGMSIFSTEISTKSADSSGNLSPPTNLQAIYLGGGNVALAWSDNDNTNTIFEIERKINGNEIFSRIATVPGNQNSYLDENLSLNTYYTYRVRSGDGVNYSYYSNEVTIYINTVQD
jgi:Fibronectin type III domain